MTRAKRTLFLAVVGLASGCIHSTHIKGHLDVTSPSLGTWSLQPTTCGTGRDGLAFVSTVYRQLYVSVADIPGPVVLESQRRHSLTLVDLDSPDGQPVTIDSSTCKTFDFQAQGSEGFSMGTGCDSAGSDCEHTYWDHGVDGVLTVDCPIPSGGQVQANIHFSCHYFGE